MKLIRTMLYIILLCCALSANAQQGGFALQKFTLPEVPDELRSTDERARYLCVHYWDHFCFADTTLIDNAEVTEQAMVDFFSILPYTSEPQEAVDTLMHRAGAVKAMYDYMLSVADKYLYEPNSPMHSDELYLYILRAVMRGNVLDPAEKERYAFRLEMVQKNNVGDKAADLAYTLRDGSRKMLSEMISHTTSEYILLFLYDPECEHCENEKKMLAASHEMSNLVAQGVVTVLAVCVEGDNAAWNNAVTPRGWIDACDKERAIIAEKTYDVKALPATYLIDKCQNVMIKEASASQLIMWARQVVECR